MHHPAVESSYYSKNQQNYLCKECAIEELTEPVKITQNPNVTPAEGPQVKFRSKFHKDKFKNEQPINSSGAMKNSLASIQQDFKLEGESLTIRSRTSTKNSSKHKVNQPKNKPQKWYQNPSIQEHDISQEKTISFGQIRSIQDDYFDLLED